MYILVYVIDHQVGGPVFWGMDPDDFDIAGSGMVPYFETYEAAEKAAKEHMDQLDELIVEEIPCSECNTAFVDKNGCGVMVTLLRKS